MEKAWVAVSWREYQQQVQQEPDWPLVWLRRITHHKNHSSQPTSANTIKDTFAECSCLYYNIITIFFNAFSKTYPTHPVSTRYCSFPKPGVGPTYPL
jgi:hypothetical protein